MEYFPFPHSGKRRLAQLGRFADRVAHYIIGSESDDDERMRRESLSSWYCITQDIIGARTLTNGVNTRVERALRPMPVAAIAQEALSATVIVPVAPDSGYRESILRLSERHGGFGATRGFDGVGFFVRGDTNESVGVATVHCPKTGVVEVCDEFFLKRAVVEASSDDDVYALEVLAREAKEQAAALLR